MPSPSAGLSSENPVLLPNRLVPAYRPLLPSAIELLPYLQRIDAGRFYSNRGPLLIEFENRLAQALNSPGQIVMSAASGWAALVGAVLASAGRATAQRDLALCPAYTFIGTASALQQCGYQPHLVDVDPHSWQMDPEQLLQHPLLDRVGVVMPVAPFGRAVAIEPWQRFREATGIAVVIDGAASIEALLRDPATHIGDVPVALSFHATKVLPCGEGGAVVGNDPALLERVFRALNFGFLRNRESGAPNINGKMSEYHAAIGLACLDRWPERIGALRAVAALYQQSFSKVGLGRRCHLAPDIAANYAIFECGDAAQCEAISMALRRDGIDSRLWYGRGLQYQPVLAGLSHDALTVTDDLAPRLLGLPVAPDLDADSVSRIVAIVAGVVAR